MKKESVITLEEKVWKLHEKLAKEISETLRGIDELKDFQENFQEESEQKMKKHDRFMKDSKKENDQFLKDSKKENDQFLKDSKKENDQFLKDSKKENDQFLKDSKKENDQFLKDSKKENDQFMKESKKENDQFMKESKKETDLRIKELKELFTGQWGKLMEALVRGDLIKLLNDRSIEVNSLSKEHERVLNGKQYEFDIIAINGEEVVAVEVKTTLKLKDVDKFIRKLRVFKEAFPEYGDKKIYGSVAYLKANQGADKNAEKKGLFVIRATGSSSSITNPKNFRPRVF